MLPKRSAFEYARHQRPHRVWQWESPSDLSETCSVWVFPLSINVLYSDCFSFSPLLLTIIELLGKHLYCLTNNCTLNCMTNDLTPLFRSPRKSPCGRKMTVLSPPPPSIETVFFTIQWLDGRLVAEKWRQGGGGGECVCLCACVRVTACVVTNWRDCQLSGRIISLTTFDRVLSQHAVIECFMPLCSE